MFNTNTLKAIMSLVPGTGEKPYFHPDSNGALPKHILGKEYKINEEMADMATGTKSILFGDIAEFLIRDVKGISVLRLTERYADYLQVGFLAFSRHDSKVMNSAAIKHILQA